MKKDSEFNGFYKIFFPMFFSFANRYIPDREEAKDIVQEVFISFWQQRENFDSNATIKAFFYRSIANKCLNFLKHEDVKNRYAESFFNEMTKGNFTPKNVICEEVSQILEEKIKLLSFREQQILKLTLQNKSNQEIAGILSLSLSTVKTHKMRAYARLRDELYQIKDIIYIL